MSYIEVPIYVDVNTPNKNSWANFYIHVKNKYFHYAQNIQIGNLIVALNTELRTYNATLERVGTSQRFCVFFNKEQDYTWFTMKWS